jgi:uncharacterized protein DUF4058
MAIHLRENQYHGINAHLHSYLQQHHDWSIFHSAHIIHLAEALQALLPPELGYLVIPERSLQIARDDLLTGDATASHTIPDVGIYKTPGMSGTSPASALNPATPGATISLIDTFSEPENVTGIIIYRQTRESVFGNPVTRIELLSPANKPPGTYYRQYVAKREETLLSGINLVELDYLHEQRSPLAFLSSYPKREPHAYPYVIVVGKPHPTLIEGKVDLYGFRVDDSIPSIAVPLEDSETVTVDLGTVYNHTFTLNPAFGLRAVNYETLPEGFDTYDTVDQQRIRDCMTRVAAVYNSRQQ